MNLHTLLSQSPVFSSLTSEDFQTVQNMASGRTYFKGEFVTHEADVWPYLLFVKSGQFQVLKESASGRSFVIDSFSAGDIFWGLALFEDNKPNPAAIQASADGEILLWDKNKIEDMISVNSQVARGLFNLMAKKMSRVGEMVEELVFQPLTGRLASLLVEQFNQAGEDVISRDLTLDQMAARIGSTREMVCKILYQFSDEDIIEIQRTELKINDRARLDRIASRVKG